jgi:hypothetical protein
VTAAPTEAPAFLVLQNLSDAEEEARSRLISQLRRAQRANRRQQGFYEGSRIARDLGISIPPHLRDLHAVAAWPEIVVDVVDERSDWRGWSAEAGLDLDLVYDDNHLGIEVGQSVLDALICGLGFLSVGSGDLDNDEPELLVKAESPNHVTATWSPRLRRATEALRENVTGTYVTGWTLMTLNETVTTERRNGRVVVTDRDEHDLNRVPMAVLLNRPRSSRTTGRSEITRAVRSLTESGMRTLLGMEIAREFYAAPQRYLMGADEEMFVDQNGNRQSMWDAVMSKMLMAPRDEDDNLPVPGQFQQASPQPFTELLKTYAQMLSAATGISANHLGFGSDNPSSADAIRQADGRLNKRAARRHSHYDLGLIELGNLSVLWRDGSMPDETIRSLWVDPATPTPAAQADRAVKMISAGVLDPSWNFTLEQFGLSDEEILRVQQERRRTGGSAALDAVLARVAGDVTATPVTDSAVPTPTPDEAPAPLSDADDLKARFDALGVAIRAGVAPEDAARRLGLDGIEFTGATPVSLRQPDNAADDFEAR